MVGKDSAVLQNESTLECIALERSIKLDPAKGRYAIGRGNGSDVQILNRSVSRRHAELIRRDGEYFVRDLESRNGTYVNNEKITGEHALKEGDIVRLGQECELKYHQGFRTQ